MMIKISPADFGRQAAWINASNQPCAKVGTETANVAIIVENFHRRKRGWPTSPKAAKEVLETRLFFVDFYCFSAKFCIFDKGGPMAKLTHDFFNGDTAAIAQALLGKYLVRNRNGELLAGRITETEAYVGRCDKACHAYNYRRTPRTETLFMAPGHAYIYFIYGMYHCLNFVTEPEGEPSAVLLRGLEPAAGAETMKHLRFGDAPMNAYRRKNFLNGPGKVCKALDLTTAQNKLDLEGDVLFLCDSMADVGLTDPVTGPEHICAGPRIGVDYAEEAKDFPWRFWLEKEN